MATKLHRGRDMKTKFGCIILPCGCLLPLMALGFILVVTGTVVVASSLF
jgi:hypothetical protein